MSLAFCSHASKDTNFGEPFHAARQIQAAPASQAVHASALETLGADQGAAPRSGHCHVPERVLVNRASLCAQRKTAHAAAAHVLRSHRGRDGPVP